LENVVFWGYTNTVLASACTITTLLVVLAAMSLIEALKVGYLGGGGTRRTRQVHGLQKLKRAAFCVQVCPKCRAYLDIRWC
jgi:hypothetical protein